MCEVHMDQHTITQHALKQIPSILKALVTLRMPHQGYNDNGSVCSYLVEDEANSFDCKRIRKTPLAPYMVGTGRVRTYIHSLLLLACMAA